MPGCWCKCGCEEAYECDPCRMGDHITMTADDWREKLETTPTYPEDELWEDE